MEKFIRDRQGTNTVLTKKSEERMLSVLLRSKKKVTYTSSKTKLTKRFFELLDLPPQYLQFVGFIIRA